MKLCVQLLVKCELLVIKYEGEKANTLVQISWRLTLILDHHTTQVCIRMRQRKNIAKFMIKCNIQCHIYNIQVYSRCMLPRLLVKLMSDALMLVQVLDVWRPIFKSSCLVLVSSTRNYKLMIIFMNFLASYGNEMQPRDVHDLKQISCFKGVVEPRDSWVRHGDPKRAPNMGEVRKGSSC